MDTPITQDQQQQVSTQDTPIQETGNLDTSQALENFKAVQSSIIDSYVNGTKPDVTIPKFQGDPNKDSTLHNLSAQKSEADSNAITESLVANPTGSTGDVAKTFVAAATASQDVQKEAFDPDKAYAWALANPNNPNAEKIKEVAGRAKLYKMLEQASSGITGWDIAKDVGMNLIPFVATHRNWALTDSFWGGREVLEKSIRAFKTLPIEQQVEVFPQLKSNILDKMGKVQGASVLSKYLDPLGEDHTSDFSNWWKLADAADIAGLAGAFVTASKSFKAANSVTKDAAQLGDLDTAAKTVSDALKDPDLRKAMNLDETGTVGNALPFDTSLEDIQHQGGLSSKSLQNLDEYFNKSEKTIQDIVSGKDFTKEGILNTVDRAAAEKKAMDMLKEAGHENIQKLPQDFGSDEKSTTFTYQTLDENGNLKPDKYTLHLTRDMNGSWGVDNTRINRTSELFASPTVWAKGLVKEDVSTAQRLDYLYDRVKKQLTDLQNEAIKPLGNMLRGKNRQSFYKVLDTLERGDEFKNLDGTRGKVFTTDELIGQYGLDQKEIEAYYKLNRLYNHLFNLRNATKRDEMVSLGYKGIDIPETGESTYGKIFETEGTATQSLGRYDGRLIFDPEKDQILHVKNVDIKKLMEEQYALGKRLARLDIPYQTGKEEGKVGWILTHETNVGELPDTVLFRKEGYVPRIYKNGAYFVKEVTPEVFDMNKTVMSKKTLRFFDNAKDAETYRKSLISKAVEDGMSQAQAEAKYVSLSDREEQIIGTAIGDFSHGSGGLYTGARAEDALLYGLEGTKAERLNPYEALTRNIANVSKYVSVNQWRLGLEQRWINSFNDYLKSKGIAQRIDSFEALPENINSLDQGAFFTTMHKQIRDWQGFPSREEQFYNATMQNMYDWATKKGYNKAAKIFGNLRDKGDPIAISRGLAFHTLLGWFNPVQLWTQAQGMATSLSLAGGKYASRVIGNVMAFTALGDMPLDEVRLAKVMKAAKAFSLGKASDIDEMRLLHQLWRKTGFADSVLQTADYAAASKGYGMTMGIIKDLADHGMLFYRNGEILNRRSAFLTAIERFKEKKGWSVMQPVDAAQFKEIIDDSINMMLNMSKANRAYWQKGLMSLPTQFLQVSTKYLETATGLNGEFTEGEIGRILAGQVALYGAAGVPLVGIVPMLLSQMGLTQQFIEDHPTLVKTYNDGFWGWLSYGVFGADLEVSDRGSLMRGITDFVDRWMFEDSSFASKALGAFGTTGQRFWDSFTDQIAPYSLGAKSFSPIDVVKIPTLSVLDTIATWRDGEKAVMMHYLKKIVDSHGNTIVNRDFNAMEQIGAAIGFRLTDENVSWDLQDRNKYVQDVNKKISDTVLQMMNDYALKDQMNILSPEATTQYEQGISTLLAGLDPDARRDVLEAVRRRIRGDSRKQMAVTQALQNLHENTYSQLETWKALILGNKIVRLGIGDQNKKNEEK